MESKEIRKVIVIYDAETRNILAKNLLEKDYLKLSKDNFRSFNLLKDIEFKSAKSMSFDIDPLDPVSVETAAIETEKILGPIDTWINSPAKDQFIFFRSINFAQAQKSKDDYYSTQVFGTMSALRRMVPRNKGKIIFVKTPVLFTDKKYRSTFKESKKAIDSFYKNIESELQLDECDVEINQISGPEIEVENIEQFNNICSYDPGKIDLIETAKIALQGIRYLLENGKAGV